MPWIVPGGTTRLMSRLACTGPKALEMPRSSIAGGAAALAGGTTIVSDGNAATGGGAGLAVSDGVGHGRIVPSWIATH